MREALDRIVFGATITDRGAILADFVNSTAGRLAKWKGRHVTVTISRYVKAKSNPQLALYFMEGGILHAWSEFTGYDPDEMHRELKRAYLVPQLVVSKLTGEEMKELPSLKDLNVEEMSTFIDRILREGRQMGIVFNIDGAA